RSRQDVHEPEALLAPRRQVVVGDPFDRSPVVDHGLDILCLDHDAVQHWVPSLQFDCVDLRLQGLPAQRNAWAGNARADPQGPPPGPPGPPPPGAQPSSPAHIRFMTRLSSVRDANSTLRPDTTCSPRPAIATRVVPARTPSRMCTTKARWGSRSVGDPNPPVT